MNHAYQEKMISAAWEDIKNYKTRWALTLDTLTKDFIKFDSQIEKIIFWLNDFCYGKNYKENNNRLRVTGGPNMDLTTIYYTYILLLRITMTLIGH